MGIYKPLHWRRKLERRRKSTGKHFVLSLVLVVSPPWRNLNRAGKKCFVLGDHRLSPFFKIQNVVYLPVCNILAWMYVYRMHTLSRSYLSTIFGDCSSSHDKDKEPELCLSATPPQLDEWQRNTLDAQWTFKGLASTFWLMISFIHYADGVSLLLIQSMHDLRLNWWTTFSAAIPQLAASHFLSSWTDFTK